MKNAKFLVDVCFTSKYIGAPQNHVVSKFDESVTNCVTYLDLAATTKVCKY